MPIDLDNVSIVNRLIRMEEKLDSYLFRTSVTETKLGAHETRLRGLEQGNARILAVAGVVALGVSTFGTNILSHII